MKIESKRRVGKTGGGKSDREGGKFSHARGRLGHSGGKFLWLSHCRGKFKYIGEKLTRAKRKYRWKATKKTEAKG